MGNQSAWRHARLWTAVATTGAGVLAYGLVYAANPNVGNSYNPNASNNSDQIPALILPAGFQAKNVDADSGVKSTLVALSDRAISKDSYDSFFGAFLSELAKQDKERASEFKGVDQDRLNKDIDQIQTAWKAKYNQDFSVSDKNLVFDDRYQIVQGEVSDPAQAVANWPVSAIPGQPVSAAADTGPGSQTDQEKAAKLTSGRDVAIIRFPAENGLPATDVSMIYQLPWNWRIDVPNDRTGEQVYNDLAAHLDYISQHQEEWPTDVNEAYRMVAHHVVDAIYGVGVRGSKS